MTNIDTEHSPEEIAAANAEIASHLKSLQEVMASDVVIPIDSPETGHVDVVKNADTEEMELWTIGDNDLDLYHVKGYWLNESGELVHYAPTLVPEKAAELEAVLRTTPGTDPIFRDGAVDIERSDTSLSGLMKTYKRFLETPQGFGNGALYFEANDSIRVRVGGEDEPEFYIEEWSYPEKEGGVALEGPGSPVALNRYWLNESGELVGLRVQPAQEEAIKFAEILKNGSSPELVVLTDPEQVESTYAELIDLFDEQVPQGEGQKVHVAIPDSPGLEIVRQKGERIIVDLAEKAEGHSGVHVLVDGEVVSLDQAQSLQAMGWDLEKGEGYQKSVELVKALKQAKKSSS